MQARRNIIYMVALCFGIKKATALLSFNPEPNQAVNATVEATDVVSTTASGGVWSLNWLFGSIVVAAVDINIDSGTIIPSIPSTAYNSRLNVTATPVAAGVFTNVTTVLTIKEVRLSDTFAIRAEISGALTPNPDSRMLSVRECNDTYQQLTPSNNANYMGTATFKCIGANTDSVLGTCQANATWSISGTCPLVQCNTTAATDSANGIILTNSALLNTLVNVSDTVSVGCGDGFNGTGGSRTCQADGTWSASISCARVCNTSAVVSNGICLSSSVSPNSNIAVGSVVSLTCCVGYIPNNGSATCANDGSWNTAVICTLIPTTPGPTTQTPTAPSDTTPIFTNNTTGTSQPTTTTKNTGCCCWWWCILLIILFFLIGILALVLWTIEFYRIYEPELGYGIKFLMLIGTVTVIPIVVFVIHQYCTRDRGGKSNDPVLVFGIKDWGVWFILCIWLLLIPGILMFRQWHEDVYLKKKQELQKKIPTKEELQKKLLEQVEPKQKWFMAICIVLGIPMVIYYFVDKRSVKQSNNEGDGAGMSAMGRTSDKEYNQHSST